MRSSPTFPKLLALAVAAIMVVSTVAAPAGAAVRLLDSSPVDGASVAMVEDIRFEFDGLLISDAVASVTLTRTNGESIPVVDVTVDGTVLSASIVAEVPSGTYEIASCLVGSEMCIRDRLMTKSGDDCSRGICGR